MNIHEYQAKSLLKTYGAPVSDGHVAETPQEAAGHAQALGGESFVVKAQIHAGGRGKGGGIKLVKTLQELHAEADRMLGKPLVTPQTGPKGRLVRRVYIVKDATIARELYLSLLVDRVTGRVAFVASTEGGVNIEEVAAKRPDKIATLTVDPATGISAYHGRVIAAALKLEGELAKQCAALIKALYKLFVEKDASLIEINPLIVTKEGNLLCLDAKIGFDDNALFRHADIAALRDIHEEDPAEVEASKHDLSYVKLDGSIGCMVNGAGLAMATMDIIKLYGGEPANFLDVGGGATKERVTEAFKIILSDPHVKGVLVNIFGGIMRCDIIAEGIIAAARETNIAVPLVVRLEGTNVERGKELLAQSGLAVIPADDLDDAAKKAVAAVKAAA
jgi:succinyl-CoA synthetase beta subunit